MTIHVAVDRALKLTLIPEKMKRFGTMPVRAADPIRKGKRAAQYLLEYRKDLPTDAPEKTLLLGPTGGSFCGSSDGFIAISAKKNGNAGTC